MWIMIHLEHTELGVPNELGHPGEYVSWTFELSQGL